MSWLPLIVFLACALVFAYWLAQGPKLWGPERGLPFCRHPFPDVIQGRRWCCPDCNTVFVRDEQAHRWVPDRLAPRPRGSL